MTLTISASLFPMGKLVITRGASIDLDQDDVLRCLIRHAVGDWGELGEFDWTQNDDAVEHGGRLLSSYRTHSGIAFWIITECDRSVTTILLPEEY